MSSSEMLRVEREESGEHAGCAVLWLEQPGKPVVVLDEGLFNSLDATLRALPRDLRGLVIASAAERSFVAGADLKTIQDPDDDRLYRYLRRGSEVFAHISSLPYPTAAAIQGAALGGGLELAMHCDGLIASPSPSSRPYPIGLPEAGLSICPGWGGTNLLPARIDPAEAIQMTVTGQTMTFEHAREVGMFDLIVPEPQDLVHAARHWVLSNACPRRDDAPSRWIGRPRTAAQVLTALDEARQTLPETGPREAVLHAIDAGLSGGWQAALAAERSHLIRLRAGSEGKRAIEAFFARGKG